MAELINMRNGRSSKMEIQTIVDMCSARNKRDILNVLEVGVYRGESSKVFLDSGKIGIFYAVDPWVQGYDDADAASTTDMHEVEEEFNNRIMLRYSNVVKHKGTLETFKDTDFRHIDLVYIDGSHKYEDVLNDIKIVRDRINPTIAICGHDFFWKEGDKMSVQQAVYGTIGAPDVILGMSSWIKFMNIHSWT